MSAGECMSERMGKWREKTNEWINKWPSAHVSNSGWSEPQCSCESYVGVCRIDRGGENAGEGDNSEICIYSGDGKGGNIVGMLMVSGYDNGGGFPVT